MRVDIGYFQISKVDMDGAVDQVLTWANSGLASKYVVTPNLSMFRLYDMNCEFRRAMGAADLVLADGWPVCLLASLVGRYRCERVTGSDLLPRVLKTCRREEIQVGLIGGAAPGELVQLHPELIDTVSVIDDGFYDDVRDQVISEWLATMFERRVRVAVLSLGAPKQEMIAKRLVDFGFRGVVLCLGGSVDFLSGRQVRAPRVVRRLGLEFVWRMVLDPSRIIPRYLRPVPSFIRSAWWAVTGVTPTGIKGESS